MDYLVFKHAPLFRFAVPDNKNKNDFSNFVFTLDSIVYLFELYFPELATKELTVFNNPENDTPICFRTLKQIYLNSDSFFWSQAAYQFSHELCHYTIPFDVAPNLCWIEESICQTASLFFLQKISKYWRRIGIKLTTTDGDLYYNSFAKYAENDAKDFIEFDLCSDSEIKSLEENCLQREKNKHVANLLLPIFQKYPKTWWAIPSLESIAPNLCLNDSLENWAEIVPSESHKGVVEIARLFGVSVHPL